MNPVNLTSAWTRLLTISHVMHAEIATPYFDRLVDAYREPHRHYHTLSHISQMLSFLQEARVEDPAALWAVWYHDYVYKPGRKTNEKKSAVQCIQVMERLGIDKLICESAFQIILATKNHQPTESRDEAMLSVLDADMAILGQTRDEYEQYAVAVRKEFVHVPKFLYQRGRVQFLREVLSLTSIYHTDWFRAQFEAQARLNIQAELQSLTD
ncbi:HD domain-containing protein [Algicola sagamiensis]|uniref:HD domain-containing protein n=1 Tax=Algicola sagamiensis TaxID=163869 RepID=UPI00035E12B5|nr:hypothetical protein [Algicola sagamiensis]